MSEIVIAAAVRTPIGSFNGSLGTSPRMASGASSLPKRCTGRASKPQTCPR